jgi:hypothetical protein
MRVDCQPVPVGLIGLKTQSLTTAKARQDSAALICGIALTAYESVVSPCFAYYCCSASPELLWVLYG